MRPTAPQHTIKDKLVGFTMKVSVYELA